MPTGVGTRSEKVEMMGISITVSEGYEDIEWKEQHGALRSKVPYLLAKA